MGSVTGRDTDWDEGLRRVRRFAFEEEGPFVSAGVPVPDGMAMVGWDQNCPFPAYAVAKNGGAELVPFTPMAQFAPADYRGDYFVENFTDAAIKARWLAARDDAATRARILAAVGNIAIPHQFRGTGTVDVRGRIDPHGAGDLHAIRRPGFFAAAPWRELIAEVDGRTSTVEIEVPREPHETIHLGLRDSIRLRGWHIAGAGVPDGSGRRIRALVVLISGRAIEVTAIHHPDDQACYWSAPQRAWLQQTYPDEAARTESGGSRTWRTYLHAFACAGFDVLALDQRGHGISGGHNDSNCNEQGEDVFRVLDALNSGVGLRILTPSGDLLAGRGAAGRLTVGRAARELPVLIGGASQGSMAACWAMHKNFVGSCDFDWPVPGRHGPYGYNVKAGMLLAPFGAGIGYRSAEDLLIEAARRLEFNVQMFTSGEVLGSIAHWPALFIGRGLWDFSESLEGSLDCFRRATGPRMIVTVRASHGEGEWGIANMRYVQARMVEFAEAALFRRVVPAYVPPETIRDLVAAAPDHWAETAKLLT